MAKTIERTAAELRPGAARAQNSTVASVPTGRKPQRS